MGVDFMLNIKFDTEFVNLKPVDFIEEILVKKLNVSNVVTGFDFVLVINNLETLTQ